MRTEPFKLFCPTCGAIITGEMVRDGARVVEFETQEDSDCACPIIPRNWMRPALEALATCRASAHPLTRLVEGNVTRGGVV